VSDPRGWEALTQQEAERDARVRAVLAKLRRATEFALNYPAQAINRSEAHTLLADRERLEAALAVAVRERDQAREALRKFGHHRTGCERFAAPGLGLATALSGQSCTCGLDAAFAGGPQT
jgi:hypothetical protein